MSNQVDQSDVLKDKFKGVTKVGDDDVEKVAKEKPDLIIVLDQNKSIKNTRKLQQLYHLTMQSIII